MNDIVLGAAIRKAARLEFKQMLSELQGVEDVFKFRVNDTYGDGSFDVITEDGGIATVHHNGSNWVSTYYYARLTDINCDDAPLFEILATESASFKDWEGEPSKDELVNDALNWLVFPAPDKWQEDNKLFNKLID